MYQQLFAHMIESEPDLTKTAGTTFRYACSDLSTSHSYMTLLEMKEANSRTLNDMEALSIKGELE
jgi:hypothetical protein